MATMITGLGGSTGYGENSFKNGGADFGDLDDGSVLVDVSSVFTSGIELYGDTFDAIYINSNGTVSFDAANPFAPEGDLDNTQIPSVAPFWTDINIDNGGDIIWDVSPSDGTVTITWLDVAPQSGTGTNSFQIVLTDNGAGDFSVDFIYEDIQYGSGGNKPAQAGVTDGSGNAQHLDGSGDETAMKSYETTDFGDGGTPGRFSITVEDGSPSVGNRLTGDEVLTGTEADDFIDGKDGNDSIDGLVGDDTLKGGTGSDTLDGGSVDKHTWKTVETGDNFHGTTGQDFFSWTAEHGSSAVVRLNYSPTDNTADGLADYVRVETTNATSWLTIGDFDMGVDKIVLPEQYTDIGFSNFTGLTRVVISYENGNAQGFYIYHDGTFDAASVFTLDEPNLIIGTDDDLLEGGDDGDTFLVKDDHGSDTIVGGEGGDDSDTIDMSGLGQGASVIYSGSEEGTITTDDGTIQFSEIESFLLTDEADKFDAGDDRSGVDVALGGGDDRAVGGRGYDSIAGDAGNDSISGEYGDDTLTGGDGNDTLDGGDGDDRLYGGAGDDYIESGADEITGGIDDEVYGGEGNDTIISSTQRSENNDELYGEGGDDKITAKGGDSTLDGGTGSDTLEGSAEGDDMLTGGAGNDVFVVTGGDDTITDFNFGNSGQLGDGDETNNDFIDLSGFYENLSELFADQADDGKLNQSNVSDTQGNLVDYDDNTSFDGGALTFSRASADPGFFNADNTGVICFNIGTRIRTPSGDRPIEDLQPGDLVTTLDNGPQPIIWMSDREISAQTLSNANNLRPVVIQKGVLGNDRKLWVSPQHGMVVGPQNSHIARAKHLAQAMPGIRIALGKRNVRYFHLMFETHQIIYAEGALSESFYPDPNSLKMLSPKSQAELKRLYPELLQQEVNSLDITRHYGPHARPVLRKSEVRDLCHKRRSKAVPTS